MITRLCAYCSKEFTIAYPSREHVKSCSPRCGYLLRTATTAERLNQLIRKHPDPTACWEWLGNIAPNGYGSLRNSERKVNVAAHRASYSINIGPIPFGMLVCHTCDNKVCCNPAHLFLGTPADNVADMDAKGRRRTIAPKGTANHNAKLTEADVLAIRQSELSGRKLAARYGVDQSVIYSIKKRTTWRHIP